MTCLVGSILFFEQYLLEKTLPHAAIKVEAAEFLPVTRFLVKRFLQGVRRLRPAMCASTPQWELSLVWDPYEPLEHSSLKALSFKSGLLRVSELCALSVHLSFMLLHSGATLNLLCS